MTDKPKCPLKFRLQAFEGGEECDEKCMWLVKMSAAPQYRACAVVLITNKLERLTWTPANVMEVDI